MHFGFTIVTFMSKTQSLSAIMPTAIFNVKNYAPEPDTLHGSPYDSHNKTIFFDA
jgi:hypothetical protein